MASSEEEFVLVSYASSASSDDEYVKVSMNQEEKEREELDTPENGVIVEGTKGGKTLPDKSEGEREGKGAEEKEVASMVASDADEHSSTGSMTFEDSETDDYLPSPMGGSIGFPRHVMKHMFYSINFEEHHEVTDYERQKEIVIAKLVKFNVLPFLPAKSLCRFRAVSKQWNMWIGGPLLAHSQTTLFKEISGFLCQFPGEEPTFMSLDPRAYNIPCPSLSFLPEAVYIRSTCNGLLACQCPFGDNSYYICNPATKQWRKLPEPILFHGPNAAIALEFEPQTLSFGEHFQLVCAVQLPDQPFLHFEIYSSKTSSWRVCNVICCELGEVGLNGDGFYLGGYAYWESHSGLVLAFNMKSEEYGLLSLPPGSNWTGALSGMGGELCYLLPREQDGKIEIEVYGDIDMRLKRTIYPNRRIPAFEDCRVLSSIDENTLLFSVENQVYVLNARSGQDRRLSCASTGGSAKYLPYVNNLATVDHSEAEAEEGSLAVMQ